MTSPVAVSYGGGVNSLAMLIGMRARGLRPDAIVFSDVRAENPETYAHMRKILKPWLASAGFPELVTVCRADSSRTKTGDVSLEAECLRLGTMPSRVYGYGTCADKWKIDPFKWWAKDWPLAIEAWAAGEEVVRAIGYDAGEEKRVGATGDKGLAKWFPLIEWQWDRARCVAEILGSGLRVPPKSACFYCPSSTKSEVIMLHRKNPDLFARAIAIEEAGADISLKVKGLGRRFSWKALIEADESQRRLFPDAPVEACTICDDGSPDEAES